MSAETQPGRNAVLEQLLADLAAEGDALRALVADLPADGAGWARPTPAPGWSIATQVAHLAWTDEVAVLAARAHTEEGKTAWDALVTDALGDPEGFVDAAALAIAEAAPADLLARWDAARAALPDALRAVPTGRKMPWFGPPMSPVSMATARFMETWAHALDVAEALGVPAAESIARTGDRVRHVVHIGVRTRDFSFHTRGLEPPAEEFRVELLAPSGETWAHGPEDAAQRVTGSAWDFALLATQRVHRADTDLVAEGPDADRWLDVAQCFAGPPGAGREKAGTGTGTDIGAGA